MQAAHPGVQGYINRFLIVGGMLLALCLPIFWLTMQGRPDPMDHQTDPNRIVWLYSLVVHDGLEP